MYAEPEFRSLVVVSSRTDNGCVADRWQQTAKQVQSRAVRGCQFGLSAAKFPRPPERCTSSRNRISLVDVVKSRTYDDCVPIDGHRVAKIIIFAPSEAISLAIISQVPGLIS